MSTPTASESLIYVNGEFLPENAARISPLDRGFLYGDAVFETIRVTESHCFLWENHLQRLELGARFLGIAGKIETRQIERAANTLLATNQIPNGFLRIQISRGIGQRGYSPQGSESPTLVMSAHAAAHDFPRRLKLMTASVRVMADEPWTQLKTSNRLPNILARRQADEAKMDEALILNHRWTIAGATAANLFCVRGDWLQTPPLAGGGIAGTTRAFVMKTAKQIGLDYREEEITLEDFHASDAAFLTSAGLLIAAVESLDSKKKETDHPAIHALQETAAKAAKTE